MISSEVRKFLAEYIDSAEQLDILMLLKQEPDAVWTAETVSNRVFTVPQAATKRLEELKELGLVVDRTDVTGAYALNVRDPGMARTMDEVQSAYRESRADVINAVFSIKADPVTSFSNAFKLRGDK